MTLVVNRDPDGAVLSQWSYERDELGNPVSIESTTGTSLFGHDELGRLLTAVGEDSAQTAFLYDACWNRASLQDGSGSTLYQTNTMNKHKRRGGDRRLRCGRQPDDAHRCLRDHLLHVMTRRTGWSASPSLQVSFGPWPTMRSGTRWP